MVTRTNVNSSADSGAPTLNNVIKVIEDGLVTILKRDLTKQCKIVVDPTFDLSASIKQNIIVNIQYIGETIESRSSSKINYAQLQRNGFLRSTVRYKLRIFFRDLRDNYDRVYDLLMELKSCLNGQKVVESNDLSMTPITIESIDFIEKFDSGIIRYDMAISLTYVS